MAHCVSKIPFILSSLLAIGLCSCAKQHAQDRDLIVPQTTQSAEEIWNGEIDESWFSGNGDSFHISTAQEFAGLANLINTGFTTFVNQKIYVDNDIHLNNLGGFHNGLKTEPDNKWVPIGCGEYSFKGVIDFQGHTVDGMYINDASLRNSQNAGLFGLVEMKTPESPFYIKNLQLYSSFIVVSENNTTVENLGSVVGKIINGGAYGKFNGLVNVVSDCQIISESTSSKFIGGLAGFTQANIINCGFTGDFTLRNCTAKIGGISSGGAIPSFVINSYSTADLTALKLKPTESGSITYQGIPIHCFYQKTKTINSSNRTFGYARRYETDSNYSPYDNGIFSDVSSTVTIVKDDNQWNGNSGIYGDNVKKTNLDSYSNLLDALNSFSFEKYFSNNLNDDKHLKKWIVKGIINNGYPINAYGE